MTVLTQMLSPDHGLCSLS